MDFKQFKEDIAINGFNSHSEKLFVYEEVKEFIPSFIIDGNVKRLEEYVKDYPEFELQVRFKKQGWYIDSNQRTPFYFMLMQDRLGELVMDEWSFDDLRQVGYLEPEILLMTHYESIHISNGRLTHTIKDIFPYLCYSTEDKDISFLATRTSYSQREMDLGYIHSHLSSGVSRYHLNNKKFCLGSSEMSMALNLLNSKLRFEKSFKDELFLVISHIKPFVEWESLSGVPYIKISYLRSDARITNSYAFIQEAREIVDYYRDKLPFYYNYYTKLHEVIINSKFHKVVIEDRLDSVKDLINTTGYDEIYGSLHEGEFISGKDGSVKIEEELFEITNFNHLTFKGKLYPLKIYGQEGNLDINNLTYNKKLENYVKKAVQDNQKAFEDQHISKHIKAVSED